MKKDAPFPKESDLCAAFITAIPKGWTAYPETAGFDILLVRGDDGVQIGVEAKLKLNAAVVVQASKEWAHDPCVEGPDFRAALVPAGEIVKGMSELCGKLGVTVIEMSDATRIQRRYGWRPKEFRPELPTKDIGSYWGGLERTWYDWCPAQRCGLPEYVPDVAAGASAPVALTQWKIAAIKLLILLERRGFVTKADFKHLKIDHSRWTRYWLDRGEGRGCYVSGNATPDLKSQHPTNWEQIAADFEKWKPRDGVQGSLLTDEADA